MGLVLRWEICIQQKPPNYSTWSRCSFSHAEKGAIDFATVAFLPAKHATSPSLAKAKPRTHGACGQAPQCANPTSASRGYSITTMVGYISSMNKQLPSPSAVSCIWSLSIAGVCAPSPPLEILSCISLERMARNSPTRACIHAFKSFSFWLITRSSSQTPYQKVNGPSSGKGHGIFRQCESGEFCYSSPPSTPRWSQDCACITLEASICRVHSHLLHPW